MTTNPKGSTTALAAAMKGDPVTDRQARSALGAAVDKIANLSRRADKSKDAMIATGTQVVHTAETQGSLFISSMTEGYLGTDKMKLGGVDVRAPVGLLAAGYGLYETMSGRAGGGHALALGNGVLGSWLASVGVQAGRILAEKRAGGANAPALPIPTVTITPDTVQGLLPPPSGLPEVDLQGPYREVLLTPEHSVDGDDYAPRRRHRPPSRPDHGHRRAGRGRRFLRAHRPDDASHDDELLLDDDND